MTLEVSPHEADVLRPILNALRAYDRGEIFVKIDTGSVIVREGRQTLYERKRR